MAKEDEWNGRNKHYNLWSILVRGRWNGSILGMEEGTVEWNGQWTEEGTLE